MPIAQWRLVVCDLKTGYPISILDSVADKIEIQYKLNKPASLSFTVPSESPLVNIPYLDGEPTISCGNRSIKAYRKADDSLPGGWEIQFGGIIWQLQDNGDADTCRTAVTVFDPLKILLEHRFVRVPTGYAPVGMSAREGLAIFDWKSVYPTAPGGLLPAGLTIELLVNETINRGGFFGIDAIGPWDAPSPFQIDTTKGMLIGQAIQPLFDALLVDLEVTYVDLSPPNGSLMYLGAVPRLGSASPVATLSYAVPSSPGTATAFDRTVTMDTLCNFLDFWGNTNRAKPYKNEVDTASEDKYYRYEAAVVGTYGLTNQPNVTELAHTELHFRKDPREIVSFVPTPELAPAPFSDWNLGDYITVQAGDPTGPSVVRQSYSGVQRVYGFTLDVNSEYGETVTEIIVSPDLATAG